MKLDPSRYFATVPLSIGWRFGLLIYCIILAYMSGTSWRPSRVPIEELLILAIGKIYDGNLFFITVPLFCLAFGYVIFTDTSPIPLLLHLYLFLAIGSINLSGSEFGFGWGLIPIAASCCLTVLVDFRLIRDYIGNRGGTDQI